MVKIITGKKGSGKTKILIEMIGESTKATSGNVVCIEKGSALTYNIDHSVRLVDTESYGIDGYDMFYGFIVGMLAGNYDITDVFIDSILKIGGKDYDELGEMFDKLQRLSGESINITFTVSADTEALPEIVTKFIAK